MSCTESWKAACRAGRVVDEAWYLAAYPDVAVELREGRLESAYQHFVRRGCLEGRRPSQDG